MRRIEQVTLNTTPEDLSEFEIDALYENTEKIFNTWGVIEGSFDDFIQDVATRLENDIPQSMKDARECAQARVDLMGRLLEGRDAQRMYKVHTGTATLLSYIFAKQELGIVTSSDKVDPSTNQKTVIFLLHPAQRD